jgi:hypothetical protein
MRWGLLLLICVVAAVVASTLYASQSLRVGQPMRITSPGLQGNSKRQGALAEWLVQHRPDRVSADNELLRRQRLASLLELALPEVERHTPAVLASLDHTDSHVRQLAMALLERLAKARSASLVAHATALTTRLGSTDGLVRRAVMQALTKLGDATALAEAAPRLVGGLVDTEPDVRWAAVDALAALSPDALASHTAQAVELLQRQGDDALSDAAIERWGELLAEHPEVMGLLGGLKFSLGRGGREFAEHDYGQLS